MRIGSVYAGRFMQPIPHIVRNGGTGPDTLDGTDGADTLNGGAGNDILNPGLGIDTVSGGGDNDIINVGAITPSTGPGVFESINGNGGVDTIRVVDGVHVPTFFGVDDLQSNLGLASVTSIEAVTFAAPGAEREVAIINFAQLGAGFANNLTITGDDSTNLFYMFIGSPGGTYTVPSTIKLVNWLEYDLTNGPSVDQVILAAFGQGDYTLNASTTFGCFLTGSGGNDTLNGNAGDDNLVGNAGVDAYHGGGGDDIVSIGNSAMATGYVEDWSLETYDGGTGTDALVIYGEIDFNGTLSSFESIAFGASVPGHFTADVGVFQSLGATARMYSYGIRNDIVEMNAAVASTLDMSGWLFPTWQDPTTPLGDSGFTGDVIIFNGSAGIDTVTGSIKADILYGNLGADSLSGFDGDDRLSGGGGIDTLAGGLGNDIYVDPAGDTIVELAAQGSDTVESGATFTIAALANVENVTLTGAAAVNATGNAAANALTGNAAANVLDGGAGADTLSGGAGDDTYVNPTGDTIVEAAGAAGGLRDLVLSATSFSVATLANVEDITLTGTGNFNAVGNNAANRLTGNEGNNTLNGGGGNDTLSGLGGADIMNGGAGNDVYVTPVIGVDTINEAAGAAGGLHDRIQTLSSINLSAVANVEDITLVGGASVSAFGNNLDNIIIGNSAANTLNGSGGNDTITGGGGDDIMNGGNGADLFKFATTNTGADTIGAFSTAQDRFDLSGAGFSSRVEAGGSTTLTHAGGTIVIAGVTGLDLAAWNALVVSGARDAPAPHHAAAYAAHAPLGHFGAADFLYA